MAEENDPKKTLREMRKRLIEGMRVKVRYGRATLTIYRSVVVLGSPIEEALKAYRREEINAEEVAWRFLREQTVEHSPTFAWAAVDLDKLLPRVTSVLREPNLKARTPEELVAELQKVEANQKAARKRLSEQIRQFAATPDYLKIMRRSQADLRLISQQNRMLTQHQETLRKMTEPLRLQESLFAGQRKQLEQIQRALQPTFTYESFGLSQSKLRQMLGLDLPKRIAELTAINNPFLEQDWRPALERVAEAARKAEAPEIAEAVEITANEAKKDGADVDLEAMQKAIEGLTEQLEESNQLAAEQAERDEATTKEGNKDKGKDSFSRQLLLQVALMAIRWMIEVTLSLNLGLPLPSQLPDPSDSEPPESSTPEPPEVEPPDSLA